MNIYEKIMQLRIEFLKLELKKSGWNSFSKYHYFELGDFLDPATKLCDKFKLCPVVSFTQDLATMTITDIEKPEDKVVITSPFSSAKLKACHEVQNVGAVETYQRRYLYIAFLEITEHDALDSSEGVEDKNSQKRDNYKAWQQPEKPQQNKFITDQQQAVIKKAIVENEIDPDVLLQKCGVDDFGKLESGWFARVMEIIKTGDL
jgi:hypothetical protein